MDNVGAAARQALYLLISGDAELWNIIGVSFNVSLVAIAVIAPLALVGGFALAYTRFRGRRPVISAVHSLQAIPAVCVGLGVYLLLTRNGPLGDLRLLFTQTAMVIGQMVLGFPLLLALAHSALQAADRRAWETARTLGAAPWRAMLTVMHEVRFALIAAVIAAFARIVAEVGASIMLGGNIQNVTRNIPTAVALETSKGEYAQGIGLGLVLLVLALTLNFVLSLLQGKGEMR
ncbi:MAG: ABC transporter permease [Sulfurifustaceae bacterium]